MDSIPGSFDIVGVAPEATIWMYKAFDCTGQAGSDTILAAMLKAQQDGVDIVSMSLGIGPQSFNGDVDPLADVTKKLTDAGIAVVVAMANDLQPGEYNSDLYSEQWPSSEPSAIGVGAIANKDFPLVYSAVDSVGSTIKYASVYPIDLPNGADVFMVDNGCDSSSWATALSVVQNVNSTIFAMEVGDGQPCTITSIGGWNGASQKPVYLMAYNSDSTDPYLSVYDTPSQGFFGTAQFTGVNNVDGATLAANFAAAGGYLKYKLNFISKSFESPAQPSGGFMDYYSDFGPTWHTYELKPQISAPGGHTLSTWPLGTLGGYCILSGTSMATPYVAAGFALVKSQFPEANIDEIKAMLQTNASPLPWIYDSSIIAATAQQGAGQINVYNAIFSQSVVSPGQLTISDVTHTEYGTANITIKNTSPRSKTYTLSHEGAGYTDYRLQYQEPTQQAIYGTATFQTPTLTLSAGQSTTVSLAITPPESVTAASLPVFGGFVTITSTDDETYHVPYIGPPYSLYNTPYLQISTSGTILPQIYTNNITSGSLIYDNGFLEINPANGFGSAIPTNQWTTEIRVDVLPANTTIKASHYGFDSSTSVPTYQASSVTPTSSIFGYESFGTLVNKTGYIWPGSYGPFGSDTTVTTGNGSTVAVGNGDYRWFASVLRWGGTSGVQADYDTWLGPVIRFVDS